VLVWHDQHIATAIFTEATYRFLGVGVPPPPSLGTLISRRQRFSVFRRVVDSIFPGAARSSSVLLAINFSATGARFVDPKLRCR
jgi:ABC-type dipeptide/oligopeptide/nickel transport system permease subunit